MQRLRYTLNILWSRQVASENICSLSLHRSMYQDICVYRADSAGCMSYARFPLFGISAGWVQLLFYQDIQRISFHALRYTLYILLSLQVACENCCSYCQQPWHDLSSYHLYPDIRCISGRFCKSHYSTLFKSSCQVLRCIIGRFEQCSLSTEFHVPVRFILLAHHDPVATDTKHFMTLCLGN